MAAPEPTRESPRFAHSPLRPFALSLLLATTTLAQLPPDHQNAAGALGPDVPAFKVRPGYRVTRALPRDTPLLRNARFLEFSSDGKTLYLSQRREDNILSLSNPDPDGVYQTVKVFVKNQRGVQGMHAHNGWLYFSMAPEGAVSRARDTDNDGVADDIQVVLPEGTLPKGGGHPFEGLLVTDSHLYVTCSDPTNMTEELDSPRKTIYVFDTDTTQDQPARFTKRIFCTGIRNTEKLRYRPGTTEIWGLDHGSDNFGRTFGEATGKNQPITDLNPPEEVNHYVEGAFYGHPYLVGNRVPRPEFQSRKDLIDLANKTTPPAWLIPAHWAPNGFTFISKDYFPDHHGDLVYCAHGSWNAAEKPVGALVERILFDKLTGRPYGSLTIVDCAGSERRFARPCDATEAPDGTLLFTSDQPNALYRISRLSPTP